VTTLPHLVHSGRVRLVQLLAVLSLFVATPNARADESCAPPRCVERVVPLPQGVVVPDNHVRVVLPEGYDAEACRRYPVLLLLHGVGDSWRDWTTKSDLIAFTRDYPVIVVTPDGGNTPDAGWYSDWRDGSRQYETFHIDALLPWVDANFRTRGQGQRIVAGFSMGGFGAMSYAARHPGEFKAAASFSGIVDTMYAYPASGPFFTTLHDRFGTPDDRVWGDQFANEATWREHNPTDRARDLKGTDVFVYSGIGAPAGAHGDNAQKPANYATEHFVFQTNASFLRSLDSAGVAYKSDFHPGYHDWPYFEAGLHWALPQMMQSVGGPDASACVAAAAGAAKTTETLPATGRSDHEVLAFTLLVIVLALRLRVRAHG
jgi:diacylglycerol O-acyltransferase/trehalose O-mycolyltransferase